MYYYISMCAWSPPSLSRDRPAYIGIADAIGDAVAAGTLAAGDRLPAIRGLAAQLGLTTATVLRGYAEAHRRGLTMGAAGRGSFVDPALDVAAAWRVEFRRRGRLAPGVYDLWSNSVPNPASWSTARNRAALLPPARDQSALLRSAYMIGGEIDDSESLRDAGVQWAARCGLPLECHRILIAAGGQHAIAAALCATRSGNAPLALPALANSGVLTAAVTLGIPVVPVRIDAQGLDIEHLEQLCRSAHPCALYCSPAAGNPIPVAMSADRRAAVARLAREHDMWLIEDDTMGALVRRTDRHLATLCPERTLWLGSISRSLGFGFRCAFVAVPRALERTMQEKLRALAWTGATPGALLAARWIADGTAADVVRYRRAAIAERHELVTRILGRHRHVMASGVPYVWLDTPPGWRSATLHAALMTAGVAVAPVAQFTVGIARARRGVRISAGGQLTLDQYRDALERIAEICAHPGRYRERT